MARPRKSRQRRQRRSSHTPAILFAVLVATLAGYLLVKASDDGGAVGSSSNGVDTSTASTDPADSTPDDSSASSTNDESTNETESTDASNLGKPIKIFSDALGDLAIDQIIEDWYPVDPPKIPNKTAAIDPKWVTNGRITINLPDGYYWAVPVSTFDENERGINFDIRQVFWGDECVKKFGSGPDSCLNDYQVVQSSGRQLYPAYIGDLLYVSLAVYENGDDWGNAAVVPSTFWSLLASGQPTSVTIPVSDPDPPNVALSGTPFLLTIVDGSIIAAQGVWVP